MRFILAFLAFCVLATPRPAPAAPSFPEGPFPQNVTYEIRRHGALIGTMAQTFRRTPSGAVEVTGDIQVQVTVLGLSAYRFRQHGTETWEKGRLKSMVMDSDDDGDKYKIAVEEAGNRLKITVNGQSSEAEAMPAATLWYPVPAGTSRMIDPVDGKPSNLIVSLVGPESIAVRGQPTPTTHWHWDGELTRDIWYDSTGRMVQVYIRGEDGSDIFYTLK